MFKGIYGIILEFVCCSVVVVDVVCVVEGLDLVGVDEFWGVEGDVD